MHADFPQIRIPIHLRNGFLKAAGKGFWQSGLSISEQNNLQDSGFRELPKENE